MSKKVYKLRDIEKILTYAPPLFILIFSIASMVVSYFIMEYQEKSQIALLVQEQKFISQNELRKYLDDINLQTKTNLSNVEKELKKNVYTLKGIYTGIYVTSNGKPTQRLKYYISEMEQNNDINFVIFDKNLNILHGKSSIEGITELIFNKKNDKKLLDITLLYIKSQGQNSSFSWKNDLTNTVQLSYFEQSTDEEIYIGAFSQTDSLRNLTANAFLNSIRNDLYDHEGFYFWLYDRTERKVFNLDNQKKWQITPAIGEPSTVQDIKKYFLTVGITQNKKMLNKNLSYEIEKIKKEFTSKKNLNFAIIFSTTLVLITATTLFLGFIKKIFTSFNRRFENKNRQVTRLKERYELAVIASNDGLWDTNFKTNKTFFSKQWLNMLGYKVGEITSYEQWFALLHVDDRPLISKAIQEHTQSKKNEHLICEYRVKTKDAGYKWILGRGKVFLDDDGSAKRLLMMSMDIDDKKQADKKMQALVKKEVTKNREKEKLLIQQNKLAAMGEMIGSIAHQWRQPLNNISLIIHFIRDNVKNKSFIDTMLNDYVERAKKQITYMSDTIDDFKDFYKPSKSRELFDTKEAIKSTLFIMQTELDKNDIKVNINGKPLHVNGYENEFKQAILNILANAKDAIKLKRRNDSSFKGQITISIDKEISIYNNGGKAQQEVLERMFEPYFTTKFEDKGTGIGLYMTKTIIENSMNGKIYAKNKDAGVVFGIIFSEGIQNG